VFATRRGRNEAFPFAATRESDIDGNPAIIYRQPQNQLIERPKPVYPAVSDMPGFRAWQIGRAEAGGRTRSSRDFENPAIGTLPVRSAEHPPATTVRRKETHRGQRAPRVRSARREGLFSCRARRGRRGRPRPDPGERADGGGLPLDRHAVAAGHQSRVQVCRLRIRHRPRLSLWWFRSTRLGYDKWP
jgi:hypothetical protein